MKKIIIVSFAVVSILFNGCGNESKQNNTNSSAKAEKSIYKEKSKKRDIDEKKAMELCDKELKKDNIDISTVKEACLIVAKNYENKGNYDSASWYYLVSLNSDYVIDTLDKKAQKKEKSLTVYYSNLAHSYLLVNKLDRAKDAYIKYIKRTVHLDLQEDFKILHKLHKDKKDLINKGDKIFKNIVNSFGGLKDRLELYNEAKKDGNYRSQIAALKALIDYYKNNQFDKVAIAEQYNNLGQLYYDMKDYVQALKYYQKALAIDEKVLGVNDPNTAIDYNSIGVLYIDLKSYKQARKYLQKALRIYINAYGSNHPDVKNIKEALRSIRYY